jgi:hypothetical protein
LRDDTTNCCTTADLAARLQREVAARESHGGEGRIRVARFPARRSLEDFDSCRIADIMMNGDPDLLARGRADRGRRRSPRCRCRATRSRGRGPATRHAGSAGAAGPARRGCLAGAFFAKVRGATICGQLIAVAARIARHGRGHITVHLPEGWHRQTAWMSLFQAACGPPATAA